MAHEIKIEEHDVFDNPELTRSLPDIVKIKQEVDDELSRTNAETGDQRMSGQKGKKTFGTAVGNQPPSAADMSLASSREIDEYLSENETKVFRNIKIEVDIQFDCDNPNSMINSSNEEKILNIPKFNWVPQTEVLTCKVCTKYSEEEMCKECVLQSVEEPAPHSSFEGKKDINVRHVTDGVKNTSDETFPCHLCADTFVFKFDLQQHLLKHEHNKDSQKGNTRPSSVKHINDKKYSCHLCEHKSFNKSNLIIHLRTHTGEKPYECDLCDYKSSLACNLKLHLKRKHTNEKNYSCHICEYKSCTKFELTRHQRKHNGEKPYQCDLCDYKCSDTNYLKVHFKRKHTHEKNYSCDICEYKSCTKAELINHQQKHSGEKPYQCDLCDYKTSLVSILKLHLKRKHTNERNYSCHMCEYKSCTKFELTRHRRKHWRKTKSK